MKLFKNLVAIENRHQLVLTIVLLCYIILDIQTPKMLANIADNVVGQGIVIILALSLFSTSNKILGLIGIVAAYEFIKRTTNVAGNYAKQFIPSQRKKDDDFKGCRTLQTTKNRFGGAGWTFYLDLTKHGFEEVARVGEQNNE